MSCLWRTWLAAAAVLLMGAPVPALEIQFDYRFDSNGVFDNPLARTTLEAAADTFDVLLDDLSSISASGSNSWTAILTHPGNGTQAGIDNLFVPADTLTVFVGGHDLGGETLGEGGSGGFTAQGSPAWLDRIFARGEGVRADVSGPLAHDFAPWGGSITFDTHLSNGQPRTWHFDIETDPVRHSTDFFSVAVHELGHVLGFGRADSFLAHVADGYFYGPQALALNGGQAIQLEPDHAHWAAETRSPPSDPEGPITAMDPTIVSVNGFMKRRPFTPLDFAALDDMGWTVDPSAYAPPTEAIPGDYNDNGVVEQGDLDLVLLNWGRSATAVPPDWERERPNGIVDQIELDGVLLNWGKRIDDSARSTALATAGVPEPSTVAICLLATLSMLLARVSGRPSRACFPIAAPLPAGRQGAASPRGRAGY